MLFTENDTHIEALEVGSNKTPYVKDAFHRRIVNGNLDSVNPTHTGTKFAAWYTFDKDDSIEPGEYAVVRFKLSSSLVQDSYVDEEELDDVIEKRREEADEFYYRISPLPMADDLRNIQRQAFAGILWCKQYYNFNWERWADGDPTLPPPNRKHLRSKRGKHIHLDHILSVRDSWEYPFTSSWDSAFGCITMAMIDPQSTNWIY